MDNHTKDKNSIAFVVELFMMFAALILVIVVITGFFVMTRSESLRANNLTGAVRAAENTAEVLSRAESGAEAARLIAEMENAENVDTDGGEVSFTLRHGSKEKTGTDFDIKVTLDSRKNDTGTYVTDTIDVSLPDREEKLYTLESGHYIPEKKTGRSGLSKDAEKGRE